MSEEVAAQDPTFTERILDLLASLGAGAEDSDDDTSLSRYEWYAVDTFGSMIRAREDRFADLRRVINQARMNKTYDQYLATVVLYAILGAVGAGIVGFGIGGVLSYFDVFVTITAPGLPDVLRAPFANPVLKNIVGAVLLMLLFVVLGSSLTGTALYIKPRYLADSRDREIQELLPTTLTYMYALSDGGMPLLDIIDRLADEEATLGAVAKEFQTIQNNMAFLGNDLKTSLRNCRSTTPNDELGELFSDLVSLIDSGGDLTPFLEDKVEEYQRRNRREQQALIDTLEVVATGYVVIGVLFPLLLMVTVTIFAAIGSVGDDPLYAIIYAGIPIISAAFLIVIDSLTSDDTATTATLPVSDDQPSVREIHRRLNWSGAPDDTGSREDGSSVPTAVDGGVPTQAGTTAGVSPGSETTMTADRRSGHDKELDTREEQLLGQLATTIRRQRVRTTLGRPLEAVRRQPTYSLAVTGPLAFLYMVLAGPVLQLVPYQVAKMTANPWFVTTVGFVVPLLLLMIPLSYFHERKYRYNRRAEKELPVVLGTLASANATGATLIESVELAAESRHGPVARQLEGVGRELQWNVSLEAALRRFTNRVRNRRVTRLFKLLIESSTTSDRVTEVLKVTEADAKFAHEMDQERLETLKIIMGLILFTFVVFIGVAAALVIRLFPPFAEAASASQGGGALGAWSFNESLYRMLFYHGILLQAVFAGPVAAKFGHDNVWVGLKFSVAGILLAVGVFFVI